MSSKKLLILAGITVLFLSSTGCVEGPGQDVSNVVKDLPEVQQFLEENPDAEVNAVHRSSEYLQENSGNINQECLADMNLSKGHYQVDVSNESVQMTAWVRSKDLEVVCVVKEGGSEEEGNRSEEVTDEGAEKGRNESKVDSGAENESGAEKETGGLQINETVLPSKQLDVPHVYDDDGAFCYIGSETMLVNYHDRNVEISDVISYTGLATGFSLDPEEGEEREEEGGKGEKGEVTIIWPPDIANTAENLGYTPHTEYAGTPSRSLRGFLEEISPGNRRHFSGEDEAYERLKQLISSGIPVMVRIDYAAIDSSMPEGTVHFVIVTGYDGDNVYVNDPSSKEAPKKDIPISKDTFLETWGKDMRQAFGPYFMFYLERGGEKKPESEIIGELKGEAQTAPDNMRDYADRIENNEFSEREVSSSLERPHPSTIRRNLALFLEEKGLEEVATKYKKSSEKLEEAEQSSDLATIADKLREAAKLEEEAYNLWN